MYKSWMWKQRSFREQFQDDQTAGGAGGTAVVDDQKQDEQQAASETPDAEQQAAAPVDQQDDEVVFTFGDEPAPVSEDEIEGQPAPAWVKELRKEARESKKRIRELEQERAAQQAAAAPKEDPVGEKPTLESCDFDAETYGEKLLEWTERKAKAEQKATAERQAQEAEAAAWKSKQAAYKAAGAALKMSGFEDAEAVVLGTLNPTQQAILLEGPDTAEASAQLVAALGRNPAKLKALAEIKSPIKYTIAVTRLMDQLKTTTKKVPPAPERQVRSTAGGATGIDNTETRLEAEADKTGDRSKLIAYRREKRKTAA